MQWEFYNHFNENQTLESMCCITLRIFFFFFLENGERAKFKSRKIFQINSETVSIGPATEWPPIPNLAVWHLLVQSQHLKHLNNVWNLLKGNNKDNRATIARFSPQMLVKKQWELFLISRIRSKSFTLKSKIDVPPRNQFVLKIHTNTFYHTYTPYTLFYKKRNFSA